MEGFAFGIVVLRDVGLGCFGTGLYLVGVPP